MKIKHTVAVIVAGMSIVGGVSTAVHASAPHPLTIQQQGVHSNGSVDTGSNDATDTTPCVTNGNGDQTGNCADAQSGKETADVADKTDAQASRGQDGDTVQAGTGSDSITGGVSEQ